MLNKSSVIGSRVKSGNLFQFRVGQGDFLDQFSQKQPKNHFYFPRPSGKNLSLFKGCQESKREGGGGLKSTRFAPF